MTDEPSPRPDAWPDAWHAALGDAALEQASSAAIFQRGRTYASAGAVQVLSEDPMPEPALHARVAGTELYATEVWIENDAVAGDCDCPNAADGWFCKHQVAVALVWRDRLAGTVPAIDEAARRKVEASARRAQTLKDKRQALHDFLHGLEASALADKLLDFADRDPEISRELQQWRKASELKDDPAELKSLVTEMLSPGRDFLSWRESGGYVQRAEAVLPLLQQARARDAGAAAAVCLHALRRAWDVLAQADDSDGEIGGLCAAIGAEWVLALQAAGPQPAAFGDTYLQLQLDDPFGCFDAAAAEAALGAAAMTRYRRALAERWRAAKDAVLARKAEHAAKAAARKGRALPYERTAESEMRLWTLERLHLAQLEAAGDIDAALAVLREDLSDAQAHSRVVAFLEAHGRLREAFAQAEQGCKAFADDWRLQEDLLRCYERDGWTEEALALRRRQFDCRPDVERYRQVLRAGQAAGRDTAALREALLERAEGTGGRRAGVVSAIRPVPAATARDAARCPGRVAARRDPLVRAALERGLRARAAAGHLPDRRAAPHRAAPAGRAAGGCGGAPAAGLRQRHAAVGQPVPRRAGAGARDRRAHGRRAARRVAGAAAYRVQGQAQLRARAAGRLTPGRGVAGRGDSWRQPPAVTDAGSPDTPKARREERRCGLHVVPCRGR